MAVLLAVTVLAIIQERGCLCTGERYHCLECTPCTHVKVHGATTNLAYIRLYIITIIVISLLDYLTS